MKEEVAERPSARSVPSRPADALGVRASATADVHELNEALYTSFKK